MKSGLLKLLTGLTIPQEYVCLGEELSNPLKVFLTNSQNHEYTEVTHCHLFIGYKPLIIALVFPIDQFPSPNDTEICLSLTQKVTINTHWRGFNTDSESISRLHMKKIMVQKMGSLSVGIYEGLFGEHKFIPTLNQKINTLLTRLRRKSSGNITLDGNLYSQVRIAYGIARKISLITVSDGSLLNLFPTDLHGPVGNYFYISSLRIGGEACNQVERSKKITISEIDVSYYQTAYRLGKNHMRQLTRKAEFDLAMEHSKIFHHPLPKGVGFYRELELIDQVDVGIHRLLIYKVIHALKIKDIISLTHIHQYYAQWRISKNLETRFLLR